MIWLTWRQFRATAAIMSAGLAALAVTLILTGPGLADDYGAGIAACTGQSGGCSDFARRFFSDHEGAHLAVSAVVLVLPALVGVFWGVPLITRELEAGTHRLIWNQSVTRTRWLAVKLGLVGLAAMLAAGLGSLAVTWWAGPIDKTSGQALPRMSPVLFDARGIVPIAYAAFAFALGVTVGLLVRRTVPAMAVTLAIFVAVQIATPLLARAHLIPPAHTTTDITEANLDQLQLKGPDGPIRVAARAPDVDAWTLSNHTVDAAGRAVDTIPLSASSGPCSRSERGIAACLAEINRLGYRQQVRYQPSSRFWALQAYETALFLALSVALTGFSFWWLRSRLS